MKIFIWQEISHGLTPSYHSGGGLAIIANDIDEARQLLKTTSGVKEDCPAFTYMPDRSFEVKQGEPYVFIFPNAGCC